MAIPVKTEASLAATGILEVLAISTVLSIRGLPERGSFSSGKSINTSVISLPLSPQPTYIMMSASDQRAN